MLQPPRSRLIGRLAAGAWALFGLSMGALKAPIIVRGQASVFDWAWVVGPWCLAGAALMLPPVFQTRGHERAAGVLQWVLLVMMPVTYVAGIIIVAMYAAM